MSSADPTLTVAIVARLDDAVLDALAERLAPRLEARLARQPGAEVRTDRWMTTAEAADHLGVTPNTLHKLTAARTIPFSQDSPGCRCYFRRSDLDRWRNTARPQRALVGRPGDSRALPLDTTLAGSSMRVLLTATAEASAWEAPA